MQQSASLAFESMEALTSKESAFSTLVGGPSLTSHGTHIREAPGQTKGKSPKAMLLQEWMLSSRSVSFPLGCPTYDKDNQVHYLLPR